MFVGVVAQMTSSVVEASFDLRVNSHNLTQNLSSTAKYIVGKIRQIFSSYRTRLCIASPMLHPTGCIMDVKDWDRKRPKEATKRCGVCKLCIMGVLCAMYIMHFHREMHPSWRAVVYC